MTIICRRGMLGIANTAAAGSIKSLNRRLCIFADIDVANNVVAAICLTHRALAFQPLQGFAQRGPGNIQGLCKFASTKT